MNAKPGSLLWWTLVMTTIGGVLAGIGPIVDMLPETWRAIARSVVAAVGLLIVLMLRSALFDRDHNGVPDALEQRPMRTPPANGPGASA